MSKVLTISIAAYNVQSYIKETLDSLLIASMDKLEVLIELDGGNDNTKIIASEFVDKYPSVFKIIEKENGGYGSTINKSIELATGKYFKQLDGDDWFDVDNLNKLVNILETVNVDAVYTPYIEYWQDKDIKILKSIDNLSDGVYQIKDMINNNEDILKMHSLAYNTLVLKNNNIKIEEHCFYTDTEYVLYPFSFCKTIYILNSPIYFYRLGIEGQSVSKEKRQKYINDHTRVINNLLNYLKIGNLNNDNIRNSLNKYVSKIVVGQIVFMLTLPTTRKHKKDIIDFDKMLLNKYKDIYLYSNKFGGKTIKYLRKTGYLLYYPLSIKRNL